MGVGYIGFITGLGTEKDVTGYNNGETEVDGAGADTEEKQQ